jgi:PAS domain S-box-containing protein
MNIKRLAGSLRKSIFSTFGSQSEKNIIYRKYAWIPIPLFLVAILILKHFSQGVSYENPFLLMLILFVFISLSSFFVVFKLTKSFHARGSLGILILSSGMLFWGLGGFLATIFGIIGPFGLSFNSLVVGIHNSTSFCAAFFQLTGILLMLAPVRRITYRREFSMGAFAGVFIIIGIIAYSVLHNWLPHFYVDGMGGTVFRQFVLSSAIVMLLIAAVIMGPSGRRSYSFMYWYSLALFLMATGLFGVLVESVHGGMIGWIGRAAQALSGPYLVIAAILAESESKHNDIGLDNEIVWWREQYKGLFTNTPLGFGYFRCERRPGSKDISLICLEVNPVLEQQLDLDIQKVIGEELRQGFPCLGIPQAMNIFLQVVNSQKSRSFEFYCEIHKRYFTISAYSPRVDYLVILLDETTARITAEKELRAANLELEQFNRAMIGREMRMIELKNQVNELCRQAKLKPAYEDNNLTKEPQLPLADQMGEFLQRSRKAAINLMNDALASRHRAEELNQKLLLEIEERLKAEVKLAAALAEAEKGHNTLKSLMQSIPLGITIADAPDARIRMVSKFTEDTLNRTFDELDGTASEHPRQWGFFHKDGVTPGISEELPLTRAIVFGETIKNEEWVLSGSDGSKIPIICTAAPVVDNEGNITGGVCGWQDVSQQRKFLDELQESEKRFRIMADAIPQLAWIANAEGDIYWFNKRCYQYTGMNKEQLKGQGWLSAHDPVHVPFITKRWQKALSRGKSMNTESSIRGADGMFRPFLVMSMPFINKLGKVERWFGTCTDISELKYNEKQLAKRARDLELAMKDLESFSYSISHDLRTPLLSLKGFLSIIQMDFSSVVESNQEMKAYLGKIYECADKMSELINDILSLSRISRQQMDPVSFNLNELTLPIVESLRQMDPHRKVDVKIAENLNLIADKSLMGLAMNNLLSNAWKYTGKKSDAVIEVGQTNQSGIKIYYIKDNGIGFDMKFSQKLFEPFRRLHHDKEFPGTGIGLAIVKKVIELHGGRIWAEASPGQGAAFYFTLGETELREIMEKEAVRWALVR